MEITGYDFRENVAIHVMCDTIEQFKDKACRAFAKHGLSYVYKYRDELE